MQWFLTPPPLRSFVRSHGFEAGEVYPTSWFPITLRVSKKVKLNAELLKMRVKWKFIVEASPWWGGFWERLVQTVKRSLRKVLFRSSVNYEELLTILIEIEGIMNSRPLTYDYSDDIEEVVKPSHLLTGKRLLSTFEEPFDDGSMVDNEVITKRMKYLR